MKKLFTQLLFSVVLLLSAEMACAQVFYLDSEAPAFGDGSSWATAFNNWNDAMELSSGGEIWVKEGTYIPTTTLADPRTAAFYIYPSKNIYGGFKGDETARAQRDVVNNETILSGNIGSSFDDLDNSYHVLLANFNSTNSLINGFYIQEGRADGLAVLGDNEGGGFRNTEGANLTIAQCYFRDNYAALAGGAVSTLDCHTDFDLCLFSDNSSNFYGGAIATQDLATIDLTNCQFLNNTANTAGGAVYLRENQEELNNNTFSGNTGSSGGAIYASEGVALNRCRFYDNDASGNGGALYTRCINNDHIRQSLFVGNSAVGEGGALYALESSLAATTPTLFVRHNTFYDNSSNLGSTVYSDDITANYRDNIFNSNTGGIQNSGGAVLHSYNCVDFIYFGTGTILADPLFVDPINRIFTLSEYSPCINAGQPGSVADLTDLNGNFRLQNGRSDMGCNESSFAAAPDIIYVDQDAVGGNSGSSWTNAYTNLEDGLSEANTATGNVEVWVAKGIYVPGTSRFSSFSISNEYSVYGSFEGGETNPNQRNFDGEYSVMSGNIGNGFLATDNCFNAVQISAAGSDVVFDGMAVTSGYADNSAFGQFEIGGGINIFDVGSFTMRNGLLANNFAETSGMVIYVANDIVADIVIKNTKVFNNDGNTSGFNYSNDGGSWLFENCLFYRNDLPSGVTSDFNFLISQGSFTASLELYGCTFAENEAYSLIGGGPTSITCRNSIFYGNDEVTGNIATYIGGAITDNIIEDYNDDPANNNYNDNPLFINTGGNDFRLQAGSPAVDTGENNYVETDFDLDNGPRILNETVNKGCYESGPVVAGITYVDKDALGANDGTSWVNAYTSLREAVENASSTDDIWVAEGTYRVSDTGNANEFLDIPFALEIIGGFEGWETSASQVEKDAHPTIISGDIGAPGIRTDNSSKCMEVSNAQNFFLRNVTVRDFYGFLGTIVGENADLRMYDVRVLDNFNSSGAAIDVDECDLRMYNCEIAENEKGASTAAGVSMSNIDNNPGTLFGQFYGCLFRDNVNTGGGGCAAYINRMDDVAFANNTIVNNAGNDSKVFIFGAQEDVFLKNNLVWNEGEDDAQIKIRDLSSTAYNPSTVIENNIFDEALSSWSEVSGDVVDAAINWNIAEPGFVDASSGDFHIKNNSQAFEHGTNSVNLSNGLDQDGNSRDVFARKDIGCYEIQDCDDANEGIKCTSAIALVKDEPAFGNTYCGIYNDYDGTADCGLDGITPPAWFTFVADQTSYTISTEYFYSPSSFDMQIAVWEGECGGDFIDCVNDANNQGDEEITISTDIGQEYFIRVIGNGQLGAFNITLSDPLCFVDVTSSIATACDPNTNLHDVNIVIEYSDNVITSGTWTVLGQSFPTTSSPQTLTLTDFPSLGGVTNYTVSHSSSVCSDSFLYIVPQPCSSIIYVDENAAGAENGFSWADAFTDFRDAMDAATEDSQIWIADGEYIVAGLGGSADYFEVPDGCKIYGGFAGGETDINDRALPNTGTIITGQYAGIFTLDPSSTAFYAENAFDVVVSGIIFTGFEVDIELPGTTVPTNAVLAFDNATGVVEDCKFENINGNRAAAIATQSSTMEVNRCIFENNATTNNTGACIRALGSTGNNGFNLKVYNSLFVGNINGGAAGTAIFAEDLQESTVENCSFINQLRVPGNNANKGDVWLKNTHQIANMRNNLWFVEGEGDNAAGPYYNSNVIFSTTTTFEGNIWDLDVEEFGFFDLYADGELDLVFDPELVDAANGDYRPKPSSPAYNNAVAPIQGGNEDVYFSERIQLGSADIGAVESDKKPIFVDVSATGANNGSSWNNAYNRLTTAVDNATAGDEIWIADGTYLVDYGNSVNGRLDIDFDLNIIGGFQGGELTINDRSLMADPVIISGNIGNQNSMSDNSRQVFVVVNSVFKLQRVTITEFNAGLSQSVADCASSDVEMKRVRFIDNQMDDEAALDIDQGNVILSKCEFIGNSASNTSGGTSAVGFRGRGDAGDNNNSFSCVITNCLFAENTKVTTAGTGAFYVDRYMDVTIENNTLVNNALPSESTSGYVFNNFGQLEIRNNIAYNEVGDESINVANGLGAPTVIIENNGFDTQGFDAMLVDPANGDYRLPPGSPALDAGTNDVKFPSLLDLANNQRIQGGTIDMGCFEGAFVSCPADLDGNGFVGVSDLLVLTSLLGCQGDCVGDLDGNNQTGVTDLLALVSLLGTACE